MLLLNVLPAVNLVELLEVKSLVADRKRARCGVHKLNRDFNVLKPLLIQVTINFLANYLLEYILIEPRAEVRDALRQTYRVLL